MPHLTSAPKRAAGYQTTDNSQALRAVVQALGAKRVGSFYMARCPVHDDRNPSLSIYEKDGKIRVKCFAGCDYRDVARAIANLGIQLWPDPSPKKAKPGKRIDCTYDYTDERGKLLYQIVRFEPKEFMPRYPDGRGGWIWKKHPGSRTR